MPIYGYECEECGHRFELYRSLSDPPLTDCPECGGKVRKLLYPVGVIFKGSGFYTTDYRGASKAGGNGSSGSDSSSSGSESSSSSGSGESKTSGSGEGSKSSGSGDSGSSGD